MVTYSLAWGTAFNTEPAEHAVLSLMQCYKRAQKSAKNCYKGKTGSHQSQLQDLLRQATSFLCVFRISCLLQYRRHIKALMYDWDLYVLCGLYATKNNIFWKTWKGSVMAA